MNRRHSEIATQAAGAQARSPRWVRPCSLVPVYPSGLSQPATSDLNVTPGVTVTNLVVAAVGADGKVVVYNYAGFAQLIVDVEGW